MIGNLIPGLISLGVAPSTNSYESIATVTVGSGGTTNIEFTSIPGTYTHLQIRGIARGNGASTGIADMWVQFNGDTSSIYNKHGLSGDGSTASAYGSASSATANWEGSILRGGNTASIFGGYVIDILDYTDTNKFTTVRALIGNDLNGSGIVQLGSSLYRATTAITSIKFSNDNSGFAQYSQFALYGIKGA